MFEKEQQEGLYTLLMVDPGMPCLFCDGIRALIGFNLDCPDPENNTFKQYVHWIV